MLLDPGLFPLAAYVSTTDLSRGDIYPTGPSMTLKPGREFAANSWVHTQLADNAPIDPMSATWVAEFHRMMMANQGGVGALLNSGPPLYIVGPDQPTSGVGGIRSNRHEAKRYPPRCWAPR
jgi:hypothetical protein